MIVRAGGAADGVLAFDQAINPYGCSPRVAEAMAAFAHSRAYRLYGDPDASPLRERLAAHHGLAAESFLVYNGAGEALVWIFVAQLLLPRGRLLVPYPTYERFVAVGERTAAEVVTVPLDSAFGLDVERVIATARERGTSVGLLSNPNNPTGNLLVDDAAMARLLDALPGVLWIVDEAYADYAGVTFTPWVAERHNLIVLRTFSKAYGLAGLRIGYAVGHPETMARLAAFRLPWNVSSMSLMAAEAAIEDQDYLKDVVTKIRADREAFSDMLGKVPGLAPHPSDANFFLVALDGLDRAVLLDHLERHAIRVRTRADMPHHIRVTSLLPDQNARLCEAIADLNA
ncbi:MAG: histidinol-phosphate transaminase [Gemmatimonadota bacterium]